MLGFISAVAFATILAVVSGLTLAGPRAVSHDLYASVFRHGRVDEATRCASPRSRRSCSALSRSFSASMFEKDNVAFMVGLAFAIAASANFPVLLLSMLWKGLTTRGAVVGGFLGLISALVLTIVSPGVWEAVFGHAQGSAIFPFVSPALFTMPLSFLCCWLFSVTDSRDRERRAGGVRGAVCALANGHRRGRRDRALGSGLLITGRIDGCGDADWREVGVGDSLAKQAAAFFTDVATQALSRTWSDDARAAGDRRLRRRGRKAQGGA